MTTISILKYFFSLRISFLMNQIKTAIWRYINKIHLLCFQISQLSWKNHKRLLPSAGGFDFIFIYIFQAWTSHGEAQRIKHLLKYYIIIIKKIQKITFRYFCRYHIPLGTPGSLWKIRSSWDSSNPKKKTKISLNTTCAACKT